MFDCVDIRVARNKIDNENIPFDSVCNGDYTM